MMTLLCIWHEGCFAFQAFTLLRTKNILSPLSIPRGLPVAWSAFAKYRSIVAGCVSVRGLKAHFGDLANSKLKIFDCLNSDGLSGQWVQDHPFAVSPGAFELPNPIGTD